MEKISKHVSWHEGTYSRTGERRDLDNTPNEEQLKCMKEVAENLFEPLREWVGGPIKINSFFRGEPVNTAIGGSTRSQHCHGQAIDLDDTFGRATNAEMFEFIKKHLDFDQIIWEFGNDENPDWVHVSYVSPDQNRKRCLKAYKKNGKTNYKII